MDGGRVKVEYAWRPSERQGVTVEEEMEMRWDDGEIR